MNIAPPPRQDRLRSLYDQIIQDLELLNRDITKAKPNIIQTEIKKSFEETSLEARHLVSKAKEDIQKAHDDFKTEEWDTFTIALYGETNAGKSTLIEGLRILLGGEIQTNLPSSTAETPRVDGETIGDGNLDYTRIRQACHFTYNNQTFKILDVPGIEGTQEAKVIKEIQKATKKAHAIFYVCPDFKSPESGTLEKIKNHLGAQTEVYAIVNKIINSPENIEKPVSQNEKEALEDLDQRMKDALGDHYIGHHLLSAKIAFLSVAKNPTPSLKKEQEKFLEKFSKEELLEKSQVKDFAIFLLGDFAIETKKKIEASNINKARKNIEKCQNALKDISSLFGKIYEDLKEQSLETEDSLEKALEVSKSKIERNINKTLDHSFDLIRKELYSRIDKEINSSELQTIFVSITTKEIENLNHSIKKALKEPINELQLNIEEAIKNSVKKINLSITSTLESFLLLNALNLDPKSNVDWFKLLSGNIFAAATLALFSGPIGWIAAGLTSLTSTVFSFSDNKPKQKEAVGKKLNEMKSNWKPYLDAKKEELFEALEEEVEKCVSEIKSYSEYLNVLKGYVDSTIEDIETLENKYLTLKENK